MSSSLDKWPEMQGLDRAEQKRLYQQAYRDVGSKNFVAAYWPMLIILPICMVIMSMVMPGVLGSAIGGAIGGGIGGAIGWSILTPKIRARVSEIRQDEARLNPPPIMPA